MLATVHRDEVGQESWAISSLLFLYLTLFLQIHNVEHHQHCFSEKGRRKLGSNFMISSCTNHCRLRQDPQLPYGDRIANYWMRSNSWKIEQSYRTWIRNQPKKKEWDGENCSECSLGSIRPKVCIAIYIMFSNECSMEQCDSFMFYSSNFDLDIVKILLNARN